MSAVYSRNLYRISGQTSADGTVGVPVPAGFVMVVKHVDVYSGDIGGPTVFFQELTTGGTWWVAEGGSITTDNERWDGMEVFETDGFAIRVVSGTWDISVNGYLLQLP